VPAELVVSGLPTGAPAWRRRVAEAVPAHARALRGGSGLALAFTVRPRQFVDLDTLAENALAGLRDAAVLQRGLPGLDAVLATKAEGSATGLHLRAAPAGELAASAPPGPAALDAVGVRLPGTGREGKRAWREALAAAWAGAPTLDGPVWAEVVLGVRGSLLTPLEPVLDALEPVLGRDPRGRDWQEFFPADDRITWLRVRRGAEGDPPVRLRLGPRAG
jgi:hypothetical protein